MLHEWPGFQVPTTAGWAAAALSAAAVTSAWRKAARNDADWADGRRLWAALALLFAGFGLNALLTLDALLGSLLRCALLERSAYDQHGAVQWTFMGLVLIAAAGMGLSLRPHLARLRPAARFALGVACALGLFLALRALSLHQVDAVLNSRFLGVSLNRAVEISLLTAFIIAANSRSGPQTP